MEDPFCDSVTNLFCTTALLTSFKVTVMIEFATPSATKEFTLATTDELLASTVPAAPVATFKIPVVLELKYVLFL